MEDTHPDCEDQVEALTARSEILEVSNDELRLSRGDVTGIPVLRRGDHLRRSVDGHEMSVYQTLADKIGGDTVTAADLQNRIRGSHSHAFNDFL